nr:N-acetyltransferase family protein [Polymorphobacter sp.]
MIRPASPADAPAITRIYAPEVLTGTATFEYVPPDCAEMGARISRVLGSNWPWLVDETAGHVTGYAYASQFRDRPAYARTCESSIYVAPDAHRQGIGRALVEALVIAARAAGFREMIAVIGDGAGNRASLGLHRSCGFQDAGQLRNVGYKFNRWLDVVYMQRSL